MTLILNLLVFLPLLLVIACAAVITRRRAYVSFLGRVRGLALAGSVLAMLTVILKGELLHVVGEQETTASQVGYLIGAVAGGVLASLIAALMATGLRLLTDGLLGARTWAFVTTAALATATIGLVQHGLGMVVYVFASTAVAGMIVHGTYLALAAFGVFSAPKPPEHHPLRRVFE